MALTQVSSAGIKNAEVKTEDILDANVTTAKIAADAITGAKIADDAVGAEHIEVLDAALQFGDNVKAQFGAGNDLEVFHDGSNNVISGTVNNWIKSTGTQGFTAGSDYQVKCVADGAVELYYDGAQKFYTHSGGAHVIGLLSGTGNMNITDSGKFQAGDSQDLKIYHTGSFSKIENSTGDLNLYADTNVGIYNAAGSETKALFVTNGAVELYHDNFKSFETFSNGITAIGPEGSAGIVQIFSDEGDDNGDKWRLLKDAGTEDFIIQNYKSGSWETNIKTTGDGNVELYYDNVWKFKTGSSGPIWAGNLNGADNAKLTCGNNDDLQIYHDGSDSYLIDNNAASDLFINSNKDLTLKIGDGSGGNHTALYADNNGALRIYYDNAVRALTTANGLQVQQAAGADVEFRIKNSANTNASATNYILSEHDGRTTAKIVFGRMNDANDFSAAAATTQGDIQFWTTQGGVTAKRATFINSGGLCFGTDTAAANALDDYEEGTWTAVFVYWDGSNWQNVTFSSNPDNMTGRYVKIGRQVRVTMYTGAMAIANGHGYTARINGLPFTTSGTSYELSVGTFSHTNCFQNATHGGYTQGGESGFRPTQSANGTSSSLWQNGTKYMIFSLTYFID